jgi:hypothetical protein
VRLLPVVSIVVAGAVVVGACSDDEGAGLGAGETSTTTTAPVAEAPDPGIVYVAHSVTTAIRRDGDIIRVELAGVERRTPWLAGDTSGVVPTGALVEQWDDLGLAADPPQAAFVPADAEQTGVILELSDPTWNEALRQMTFVGVVPEEVDASLVGLVAEPDGDAPAVIPDGEIGAATIMIHQLEGDEPEPPGPTTTTTSTTEPTTATTSGPTTTTSSTVPISTTTTSTTVFVPAPQPPTPPQPPPSGDPRIVASTTELRLPSNGGSTTFTLRNVGSGVGSWSINASQDVGISVAPSSGVIFPGGVTTVGVSYDRTGPADDFRAELLVVTAQGTIAIEVTVGGN